MTILAPTPTTPQHTSLLTGRDVLDIAEALRNAAANNTTTLDARDRQALALLTYWDGLNPATRILIDWVAVGRLRLPLTASLARALLRTIRLLPDVPDADRDAWLSAREKTDANEPVDRGLKIIAAHAARVPGTATAEILRWAIAVVSAEITHADPSPIPDSEVFAAHEAADRLVERERARMLAAEYGQTPAAVNAR
jgi:hypothetical protein